MLIWYGNLPEETVYFMHRTEHGWLEITLLLTALRFAVPFFLLLSRPAKTNPRRLAFTSVLVLVGQLTDLYWLIMPQLHHEGPRFGWHEAGPLMLLPGILLIAGGRLHEKNTPSWPTAIPSSTIRGPFACIDGRSTGTWTDTRKTGLRDTGTRRQEDDTGRYSGALRRRWRSC